MNIKLAHIAPVVAFIFAFAVVAFGAQVPTTSFAQPAPAGILASLGLGDVLK